MTTEETDHTKWNPTPEQFAAYQKREVEMAFHNIKNFGLEATLHSSTTINKAIINNTKVSVRFVK